MPITTNEPSLEKIVELARLTAEELGAPVLICTERDPDLDYEAPLPYWVAESDANPHEKKTATIKIDPKQPFPMMRW